MTINLMLNLIQCLTDDDLLANGDMDDSDDEEADDGRYEAFRTSIV